LEQEEAGDPQGALALVLLAKVDKTFFTS